MAKNSKPWITKVEKEVDTIRDRLQKEAEKVGWDTYFKESWKKTRRWLEGAGFSLKPNKKGGYVIS